MSATGSSAGVPASPLPPSSMIEHITSSESTSTVFAWRDSRPPAANSTVRSASFVSVDATTEPR
jgi:hypothetical protein